MSSKENSTLRRKIRELCQEYPELVIQELLEAPFWPSSISTNTLYARGDDDTAEGEISVAFSPDGDGWVEVLSHPDPAEMSQSHRFRTYFGGGQSLRTQTALKVLAVAIQLDNQERPQHRQRPEES